MFLILKHYKLVYLKQAFPEFKLKTEPNTFKLKAKAEK